MGDEKPWLEGGKSWRAWELFRGTWLPVLGPVGFELLVEIAQCRRLDAEPTYSLLAARLGLSRSTLQRRIGELVREGILVWTPSADSRGRSHPILSVAGLPEKSQNDPPGQNDTPGQNDHPGQNDPFLARDELAEGALEAEGSCSGAVAHGAGLPEKSQNDPPGQNDTPGQKCATVDSFCAISGSPLPQTPSPLVRQKTDDAHARGPIPPSTRVPEPEFSGRRNVDRPSVFPDPAGLPDPSPDPELPPGLDPDSDLPGHDPADLTAPVVDILPRVFDGKANHGMISPPQAQALVAKYGERAVWTQMCWLDSLPASATSRARSLAAILIRALADRLELQPGDPGLLAPRDNRSAPPEAPAKNPYAHLPVYADGKIYQPDGSIVDDNT